MCAPHGVSKCQPADQEQSVGVTSFSRSPSVAGASSSRLRGLTRRQLRTAQGQRRVPGRGPTFCGVFDSSTLVSRRLSSSILPRRARRSGIRRGMRSKRRNPSGRIAGSFVRVFSRCSRHRARGRHRSRWRLRRRSSDAAGASSCASRPRRSRSPTSVAGPCLIRPALLAPRLRTGRWCSPSSVVIVGRLRLVKQRSCRKLALPSVRSS